MKVVNHELALPQDTIMINEYMKNLPEDMKPEAMPDEDKCRFFTNYGTMKGLQPGLQAYIYEMTGKNENETPADYEAYAAGLAMIVKFMSLEAKQESGQDPYSYGGAIGGSIAMQSLPFHFTESDFLDGCKNWNEVGIPHHLLLRCLQKCPCGIFLLVSLLGCGATGSSRASMFI